MTISGKGAKWLIGVGVVSLCLNLFLVGLMAGHWIHEPRFGHWGHDGPGGPRHGLEAMIDGLPSDLRPLIKQKFEAARPQFEAARDQIRAARDKVAAAAGADPFDPAAFDRAFGELQQGMDQISKIAHETIKDILPQIPAAQRKALVDQWSKRWDRRGDRGGPPPGPQPE